ncbi:MAG: NmrA family NAD(P)-binding protein [Labilithrix sp.]|nr:NmrA family NAD(P)-binding protein [Labilithrix sp.]
MFVVAGVTGNTGAVVAEALLAAGKKVRVLVRDAAKGAPWRARGADVRLLASLDDASALAAALEGAEGAYLLSPPNMGAADFIAERRATVDAFAAAIERSRVPHVVFLSSVGGQHAAATGPIRTVHYGEQRLAKTDAKLTFVRAAYFLENWAAVAAAAKGGKLPTFLPADLVIPMVATRDIGAVAAKALLDGPPASKIDVIELAGAKDLSSKDVAAIFGRLIGRSVEAEEAPLEAVVPTFTSFGASASMADLYREMYEGVARGIIAWEGSPKARAVRGTSDPESVLRAFV